MKYLRSCQNTKFTPIIASQESFQTQYQWTESSINGLLAALWPVQLPAAGGTYTLNALDYNPSFAVAVLYRLATAAIPLIQVVLGQSRKLVVLSHEQSPVGSVCTQAWL